MIVMGVTGKSKVEKTFIGNSSYPVLVVPVKADLKPVSQILFACDLNEVAATTPLQSLDDALVLFDSTLTVLNVDDKNRHFSPQNAGGNVPNAPHF